MSTGDDSSLESLERRALAEVAARRNRDAIWRREAEEQEAREAEELVARAVRQVEQRLGHRTSPADWKVAKDTTGPTRDQVAYAVTRLLGVQIRVNANAAREPELPEEGTHVVLTLTNFGKALEHVRQRLTGSTASE